MLILCPPIYFFLLHIHLLFSKMMTTFAISALGLILAPIASDARLFDATKRLRVEAKEEESGILIRGTHLYERMTMDGQRILDADLSMSMPGACATLDGKHCRKDETCTWDGVACTEGTSFPTYSPTTASEFVEIVTADMLMSMPTYSPTGPYPTYSPTELTAKRMPPTASVAACALHLTRKPCVKDSICLWDGSVCSALRME
jgi:hypothetical protein